MRVHFALAGCALDLVNRVRASAGGGAAEFRECFALGAAVCASAGPARRQPVAEKGRWRGWWDEHQQRGQHDDDPHEQLIAWGARIVDASLPRHACGPPGDRVDRERNARSHSSPGAADRGDL
jgi:hypothetical protein